MTRELEITGDAIPAAAIPNPEKQDTTAPLLGHHHPTAAQPGYPLKPETETTHSEPQKSHLPGRMLP